MNSQSEKTTNYPVLKYSDKKVQKKINDAIASVFFDEVPESMSALNEKLKERTEFTQNIEHTITYNKKHILSFYILSEECAAYCSSYVFYFNFDKRTGEVIEWTDLISPEIKDSFQFVFEDRIKRELNEYRESDLDSLAVTDSSLYEWVIESFQNCLENINISGFAIYPDKIEFANECNFPKAIHNYAPHKDFIFSPKDLAPFLKPEYFSLFDRR